MEGRKNLKRDDLFVKLIIIKLTVGVFWFCTGPIQLWVP